MLKQTFFELVKKYSDDLQLIEILWKEIERNYSSSKRYYHNLAHLENLLAQLLKVKMNIEDWDIILFSLYYHDIVYKASKKNNEEKSAEYAQNILQKLNFSKERINSCFSQIIATKGHTISTNNDTNLFTDADLSILGFSESEYKIYHQQIRKEYKMYPSFMYNPSRKKVLQSFLKMNSIFKTSYFFDIFEKQARINIALEINNL